MTHFNLLFWIPGNLIAQRHAVLQESKKLIHLHLVFCTTQELQLCLYPSPWELGSRLVPIITNVSNLTFPLLCTDRVLSKHLHYANILLRSNTHSKHDIYYLSYLREESKRHDRRGNSSDI